MVLDTSTSMDGSHQQHGRPRITRMNEAASNFVQFYVNDGSQLGVTHFSDKAKVDIGMTVIDESTRSTIADLIDFRAIGSTCLGIALQKGLEVLYGDANTTGGVIMFLTDG